MPTAGLFLLLIGGLLIRQVVVGRVKETPSDLKELSLALLSGDTARFQGILSARGENVSLPDSGVVAAESGSEASVTPTDSLLQKVILLGNASSGYSFGATGPKYYDCSGIIWQAMKQLDIYKGGRFTTSTFDDIAPKFAVQVTSPSVGDIVLWKGKHMGIISGADSYYSARSKEKGIGYGSLSADRDYFAGITPEYWRIK
jgi:cell wall-associated NlpC family hydrolase